MLTNILKRGEMYARVNRYALGNRRAGSGFVRTKIRLWSGTLWREQSRETVCGEAGTEA